MTFFGYLTSRIAGRRAKKNNEKRKAKKISGKRGAKKNNGRKVARKSNKKKETRKITERSHSNILPYKKRIPFVKMLFELIYNPYFEIRLFVINMANNNELSYPISTILL